LARRHNLVLLGAPGVGKGTQAALLSEHLRVCHLSTGDLFRSAGGLAVCERTPALAAALDAMRRGELVPDEIVLALVHERRHCFSCNGGFLLDGFPRTLAQAVAFDALLAADGVSLDAVLSYELPIEEVVERLGGRRVCPQCRAVYHVTAQPTRQAGVCDACGAAVVRRADDEPDAVRTRMETYARSTRPLIDFYRDKGLLRTIPADGTPAEIFTRTMALLGAS
jgi:adenylate kinase